MTSSRVKRIRAEQVVLGLAGIGLAISLFLTIQVADKGARAGIHKPVVPVPVAPLNIQNLENISKLATEPAQSGLDPKGLFVGGLRVVAIGSAYPIPYEAEVCPFSMVPQPAMNQLDRDGDEITDDWELKYGLNKYNASDALLDLDSDGFSNLEEFKAASEPRDPTSHPPYAGKLRFVDRKDVPFFLVFKGFIENQDGSVVFQLNVSKTGKSHFASLGESVEGVEIERFEPATLDRKAHLYVRRGSAEIELERGAVALDPESKAELINILDQSPIMVTMGALLSLHNDEYTVLGVYSDKVILKDLRTGKVFDVVGFADGER